MAIVPSPLQRASESCGTELSMPYYLSKNHMMQCISDKGILSLKSLEMNKVF